MLWRNGAQLWKKSPDLYKQVMQLKFIYYANQRPEKEIDSFCLKGRETNNNEFLENI